MSEPIKADLKQCETEITAFHPFRLGREPAERCKNATVFVVREKKATAPHGKRGEMGLCAKCFEKFMEKYASEDYVVRTLKPRRKRAKAKDVRKKKG